ncbi:hypothetical protein Tco_0944602 [Tanacetum coccineum]
MNELVNDVIKLSKLVLLVKWATKEVAKFLPKVLVNNNRTFKIVLMMKRIQEAVHEYLNDLEEEYQARALLAKSKRFFKKGKKQLTKLNATNMARKDILQETAGQKLQFPHINHPFNQNLSIPLNTNQN